MNLHTLRRNYNRTRLEPHILAADPLEQFKHWFSEMEQASQQITAQDSEAQQLSHNEINAMTLSTVSAQGQPSARIVLLKEVDDKGFIFYTNYHSHKAVDIHHYHHVALVFYWGLLERQVRVEGHASPISTERNQAYFQSRPYQSQLGAWASSQSEVIADYSVLERKLAQLMEQYPESPVPLPPFWGGYCVVPERVEFWQGRPNRLHDRFQYVRPEEQWVITRLSP